MWADSTERHTHAAKIGATNARMRGLATHCIGYPGDDAAGAAGDDADRNGRKALRLYEIQELPM